jgi:MFS family permease
VSEPAFRHRDVVLLALATAVAMTCASIMAVTSALVGQMLAFDKALATLPLSLQFVATMATMFPAAFLMRRYGRRVGFLIGALFGTVGGAIMFWSTLHADFVAFSIGNAVIGIFNAFTAFYRSRPPMPRRRASGRRRSRWSLRAACSRRCSGRNSPSKATTCWPPIPSPDAS